MRIDTERVREVTISTAPCTARPPGGNFLCRQKVTKELPRGDAVCRAPARQSRSPLSTPLGARLGQMVHLMGLKLVQRIHCSLICHQRVRHCADIENAQEMERIQTSQRT